MFKWFREFSEIKDQVFESRKLAAVKDAFIVPALNAIQSCDGTNVAACREQIDMAAAEVRASMPIDHPFLDQLEVTQKHIKHCFQLIEKLGRDGQTSGLWIQKDAMNALKELQAWSGQDLYASNANDWYEPYVQQSSVA